MATKRKKPGKKRKGLARSVPPYPIEFRVKVARLHVEDGYPAKLIAQQFGISDYSVYCWGKSRTSRSCERDDRGSNPLGDTILLEVYASGVKL